MSCFENQFRLVALGCQAIWHSLIIAHHERSPASFQARRSPHQMSLFGLILGPRHLAWLFLKASKIPFTIDPQFSAPQPFFHIFNASAPSECELAVAKVIPTALFQDLQLVFHRVFTWSHSAYSEGGRDEDNTLFSLTRRLCQNDRSISDGLVQNRGDRGTYVTVARETWNVQVSS